MNKFLGVEYSGLKLDFEFGSFGVFRCGVVGSGKSGKLSIFKSGLLCKLGSIHQHSFFIGEGDG